MYVHMYVETATLLSHPEEKFQYRNRGGCVTVVYLVVGARMPTPPPPSPAKISHGKDSSQRWPYRLHFLLPYPAHGSDIGQFPFSLLSMQSQKIDTIYQIKYSYLRPSLEFQTHTLLDLITLLYSRSNYSNMDAYFMFHPELVRIYFAFSVSVRSLPHFKIRKYDIFQFLQSKTPKNVDKNIKNLLNRKLKAAQDVLRPYPFMQTCNRYFSGATP